MQLAGVLNMTDDVLGTGTVQRKFNFAVQRCV